jgi:GDP-L-fucose synthase
LFKVWGSSSQQRDFIHVDDIVDAVLSTYNYLVNGSAINLCTGVGTNFLDLAQMICNELNFNPVIVGDLQMPQGVHTRIGDPTTLNSYGWKPKKTLIQGIKECLEYQLKQIS